jgi:DNA-binding HxlR family transcriptional regulator
VGERWALLVVRELVSGPTCFTDLRIGLPQVSPNVLSQRLRDLEHSGVIQKRKLPPPASVQLYELTPRDYKLELVLIELGKWGVQSLGLPRDGRLDVDSLILSFRTVFNPESAKGLKATYDLRLGEDRFVAKVANNELEIVRGEIGKANVKVETSASTLTGCSRCQIKNISLSTRQKI